MIFNPLEIDGPLLIKLDLRKDERGFFARSFCFQEFEKEDISFEIKQTNISFNKKAGTLRGLHYQTKPHPEKKIIRCVCGEAYVIMVDLRAKSQTFGQWIGIVLKSKDYEMLYIPEYFAVGFQTMIDDTEINYYMSEYYHPECAKGIKYNDESLNLNWPLDVSVISEKDKELGTFKE